MRPLASSGQLRGRAKRHFRKKSLSLMSLEIEMAPRKIHFEYAFHPAGQGLFTSGWLRQGHSHSRQFRWVYDCGTLSGKSILEDSIQSFATRAANRGSQKPTLDFAVISHFDHDHISGMVSLLTRFTVRHLLLPYIPLWQRLVLAFDEELDFQRPEMAFYLNPVTFFSGLGGVDIERMIFVPGTNEHRGGEGDNLERFTRDGDIDWQLQIEETGPHGDDQTGDFELPPYDGNQPRIAHGFLRPGGKLRLKGFWEFIPYNDAVAVQPPSQAFLQLVENRRNVLLTSSPYEDKKVALAELKDEYDRVFGSSSVNRNLISLFLYAGPIGSVNQEGSQLRLHKWVRMPRWSRWPFWWHRLESFHPACGVLYTGDGYLDTQDRLDRLINHLGPHRVQMTGCMQVMHHGSKHNWHPGLADRIRPFISIFSSDPNRRRWWHPHAEVLRDFWPYHPVQVDKYFGASCTGFIEFP